VTFDNIYKILVKSAVNSGGKVDYGREKWAWGRGTEAAELMSLNLSWIV
jgi:hypothetical protein